MTTPTTTWRRLTRQHLVVAASIGLTALAALLAALALVTRRLLHWRQLAGWEAAWRSVSPRWSQPR